MNLIVKAIILPFKYLHKFYGIVRSIGELCGEKLGWTMDFEYSKVERLENTVKVYVPHKDTSF